MLAEIRDYIKSLEIADHCYIGKIENKYEKVVGVYGGSPMMQIESIGQCSSYKTASLNVLVHWTKNASETESAARALYEHLKDLTDLTLSGTHIQYAYMLQDEPIFLGTDDNGIYEYSIPVSIYYRR